MIKLRWKLIMLVFTISENMVFAPNEEEPVAKKARVEMKQVYGVPTYDALFKSSVSKRKL